MHLGREVLEGLCEADTSPADAPLQRVRISKCGATNAKGTHDALEEGGARETAAEAAERLAKESRETKASIM